MHIEGDADMAMASCERYHSLLSQVTGITDLHIYNDDLELVDIEPITLGPIHDHARHLDLKLLSLFALRLGNFYTQITNYLNIMGLSTLKLDECPGIQPLIRALTAACATETPALRVLQIYLPFQRQEPEEGILKDIGDFLLSFSGLEELSMQLEDYGMVSKTSIINHKATLQVLLISCWSGAPIRLAAAELNDILLQCTSLEQLALSLDIGAQDPWIDMCRDSLGLAGVLSSITRTDTDLARSMVVTRCIQVIGRD